MTPAEQLKEQVAQLQQQLLAAHPQMPVLLKNIHTQLKSDPEIVTLLTEEEICTIVRGLEKQTNSEIASVVMKSKTKSVKKIGLADL